MKSVPALVAVLLALTLIARAAPVEDPYPYTSKHREQVWLGNEWKLAGITYVSPWSEMVDSETIRLGGTVNGTAQKAIRLPWKEAPWNLQSRLKKLREARIELEKYIAAQKAKGLEFFDGTIIGRTADGFLVHDTLVKLVIHVRGKTALFDGDEWSGWVKFTGEYQYTATGGRLATVRGFTQEEGAK